MTERDSAQPPPGGEVSARAGTYYRNARYALALGVILYGFWNIYDGFYNWPRQNELDRQSGHDVVSHSDMDLLFNRVLGIGLPPVGVLVVLWMLHKSRGEYRLSGQILHLPGHPPIPLPCIDSLDKGQWDRKGVAIVTYKLPDGRSGTFKLDDFVYQRDGIDEIYRRIELSFQHPEEAGGAGEGSAYGA